MVLYVHQLCKHLPARAEGYSWTLIYSSSKHGFSLKTMYREMLKYETPVLLVIEDTFGTVSPHFCTFLNTFSEITSVLRHKSLIAFTFYFKKALKPKFLRFYLIHSSKSCSAKQEFLIISLIHLILKISVDLCDRYSEL